MSDATGIRQRARQWSIGTIAVRVAAITVIWFILAEGEFRYWGIIIVAIGAASLGSLILVPSSGLGWSLAGWARFIPFFLAQSVMGGIDVALRALSPRPRLDPAFVKYRLRLHEEPARVLVANTISLMPGTLSVSLEGRELEIHVLDQEMPAIERVREIEEHAARMFRLSLASADDEVAPVSAGQ